MFDSKKISAIIDEAERLLGLVIDLPENERPERKGFYLCVRDRATGLILLLAPIGQFDDPKFARNCCRFAREKTERLLSHPDHYASSQSANPELELYGGGVACQTVEVNVGISGLTAICDEAVATSLGLHFSWITPELTDHLVDLTKNKAITSLCRAAQA